MKEQYISPELNPVVFAPVQAVANNIFEFDDLENLAGGVGGKDPIEGSPNDINYPLGI